MITKIYLLICIGVYIYIQFFSSHDKLSTAIRLGAFYPIDVKEHHEYWRMITCHFIHIDFFHIFMNAYAFYDLGSFFEVVLGKSGYILLIVISMLLSALLCYSVSLVSDRYDYTVTFGASGVVFGFFGAIIALGIFVGGYFISLLQDFMPVIAINLIYTFANSRVSKTGHIGGFIGGIVAIVIFLAMQMVI